MKVMIPVSGGLDSTALLHHALTTTEHDIFAVHYMENYNAAFIRVQQKLRIGITSIVASLKASGRDFDFRVVPVRTGDSTGQKFSLSEATQVLAESVHSRSAYWIRARNATHGYYASVIQPAEVWSASNLWNVGTGITLIADEVFREYVNDIRLVWPWKDAGLGRFSLMRRLNATLEPLVVKCSNGLNDDCGTCGTCRTWAFYRSVCASRTVAELKAIDRRIRRLMDESSTDAASLSPTQVRYQVLADEAEWVTWLTAGADPQI